MPTLSQAQLEGLKKYKYSGVDKSLLSKTVLTPYWNALVKLFPMTIAPNTITFLGLCFVITNVITLLIYDPSYSGQVLPSWVYWSWAFGLFAYQSMDAIDGKQARRTGMSGPLGEMFDHGCDAINTSLEVILAQAAFGVSRSWWTVASEAATLANFYLSTWEEYHTGTLYLSEFSGPVEGILLICVIYMITAIKGPGLWSTRLVDLIVPIMHGIDARMRLLGAKKRPNAEPGMDLIELGQKAVNWLETTKWFGGAEGMRVNDAFMMFAALGLIFNVINSYYNVIQSRREKKLAILPPLLGLLPFMTHTAVIVAWLGAPNVEIIQSWKMLVFMAYWGFTFAYQVSHLILAHVTKSSFPYWNGMMVWTLLAAIDANAPLLFGRPPLIQSDDYRTGIFVSVSAALAFINYIRFAKSVIWQITDFTNIACFTVKHKDSEGHWVENEQAVDEKKKKQ